MKIAEIAPPWLAVPPRGYGGSELVVGLLAEGLNELGAEVRLFCSESPLNIPVHPFQTSSASPDKYSENDFLAHCLGQIGKSDFDLVHSHLETFAGFQRVQPHPWPTVINLHIPISQALIRYLARFPEIHYVVPGQKQFDLLASAVPRLHQIPHGLPMDRYTFKKDKESFLLFMGRVMADKGTDDAIRLARAQKIPLVIAGPVFPADEPFFRQKVEPWLVPGQVEYVGEVGFERKNHWLGRARALVHPVKVEEAFGLTLVEAMACGTPVLAYGRGEIPRVVQDGVSGIVVDDFEGFLSRWDQLALIRPEDCRRSAAKRFPVQKMTRAYFDLFADILAGASG